MIIENTGDIVALIILSIFALIGSMSTSYFLIGWIEKKFGRSKA